MALIGAATPTTSLSFFSSSIFQTHKSSSSSTTLINFKPNNLTSHYSPNPKPSPFSITSQLATLPLLSFNGDKIGEAHLDLKSAPPSTARAVVHRAIVTDLQNKRRGTASTLTRAEVRGGGRKPYAQKKTGRARRGSNRTPLRPGGGVIFGPKPRDWTIKINRKEKRLAISTAMASAAAAANAFAVEEFAEKFEKPKTKDFIAAMKRWGLDPKEKATFLMTEVSEGLVLSSRNIGTLKILTPRTLNLYDILNADKVVLTPSAVDYLNERYGVDYQGDDDDDDEEVDDGEEEGPDTEDSADVVD